MYIENIFEMHQSAQAIAFANNKSRTLPGNREQVFMRELKRKILEIASQHVLRQKKNEPDPDMRMPGVRYQIWGLEPNLARLFRLARLEGTLKEKITIKRGAKEFLFKSADRYTRIMTTIQECVNKAQGSDDRFIECLMVEAGMIFTEDYEEEQRNKAS
jgi:hypothetical protein